MAEIRLLGLLTSGRRSPQNILIFLLIEFLQQEWINDGDFMGIGDERDPIVGLQTREATFTIPKEPVRRRIHGIETFNVLRGGEYFFMPSISALHWLANLPQWWKWI